MVGAPDAGDVEITRCAICGRASGAVALLGRDEFFGSPGEFTLVRCDRCDLVYLNPRPMPARLAAYYPASYYAFHAPAGLPSVASGSDFWARRFLAGRGYGPGGRSWVAGVLAAGYGALRADRVRVGFHPVPVWKPGGRLLEVGSGAGFYLAEMKKLGWQVAGVEISPQACGAAREAYGLDIHCGTLADAPFPEGTFDVVAMFETLEHLPDPIFALRRAHALTAPGGVLIGSVPNFRALYARWFGPAYYPLELPRHLYHYSAASLRRMLSAAGYGTVRIRTFTPGASAVLVSLRMRRNRREGRHGIPDDFWAGRSRQLRAATWALKPWHLALDACGVGIHLEFEARRA
jgi:SAM-dependent methyltransferase